MKRPLPSLKRLSFDEKDGKVCYRYGESSEEVERMEYLEFIARTTSHIPEKGQVMVRYFGLYANARRGKVRKAGATSKLLLIEEECPRISRRGCPETNRKIYEVDPLRCSQCQAQMRIIAFISNYAVVDRIINHLKLTFVAERPPPPHMVYQKLLMTAEPPADYFS